MKVSILAFAPLGLVTLLAMVSASPTDLTVNTGADANVRATLMTVVQVYTMVNDIVNEANIIFRNTAIHEFTANNVKDMFIRAGTIVNDKEKAHVKKLDEGNPVTNEISFSKLLDDCSSQIDAKVEEICAALVDGFNNGFIPRYLFEASLNWAHILSETKTLINDYATITKYFPPTIGEKVVISKEAFMEKFGEGIVDDSKKFEEYFNGLDDNEDGELDDRDLEGMQHFLDNLKSVNISDPNSLIHRVDMN
ncbi:hypothetical protein IWQ61_009376 [Dispira simplex]|nr:hypothetical protein IWQ61_009376 [Dispira simplex]